jgi:hypothetical protein
MVGEAALEAREAAREVIRAGFEELGRVLYGAGG